jgi:hypothetical protein
MNTTKKKLIVWLLSIICLIAIALFVLRKNIAEEVPFGNSGSREAVNEIEVTTNIGWWTNQNDLKIDSLKVELIDSRLNLFNSHSLIRYTVRGRLTGLNHWKPYIAKVHISERFIKKTDKKDTCKIPEALIEITPIVSTKENKKYNGEVVPFEFTNEIKVQSFHWGINLLRIQCGNNYKDVKLIQRK